MQDRDDLAVEPRNDCGRRARGHHHSVPGVRLESRQSDFIDRGQLRRRRRAPRARHRERPKLPVPHVREGRRHGREHELHLATEEIRERRRRAFVRHVNHPDPRHRVEQLPREVRGRAVPGRGEVDLARPGLGERDQLLDGRCPKRRVNDEHVGRRRRERHRREVPDRIEGHLAEEARVDRERSRRAHQQRVAVGGALRDDVGADVAARAGPIVDQHLLREALGELLRDRARDDVGAAARRESDDEANRLGGVGLRRGRVRRRCRERGRQ